MKAERLHELADAYGADLRRWPASERAFAESLLAADPSLKAVLDEAATLDALLNAASAPVPSAALTARILAAAPKRKAHGRLGRAVWYLGAGWAAAASCPPFTRLRCLRSVFIRAIGAPEASSAAFTACFSASVTPSAGATSSAEAPPEIRASTKSPSPKPARRSSMRRVAVSPARSGTGCAASTISIPRQGRA